MGWFKRKDKNENINNSKIINITNKNKNNIESAIDLIEKFNKIVVEIKDLQTQLVQERQINENLIKQNTLLQEKLNKLFANISSLKNEQ
jgi:uncharacterized membrane protein